MNKKIRISFFALLVVIIGLISSVFIFPQEYIPYLIPKIDQIQNVQAIVKNDTAFVKIKIITKGNIFFSVSIDTLKYKISFFDKVYLEEKHYVGGKSHTGENDTIRIFVKVPYKMILKDLERELKTKDSTDYTLNLFIHYSTFLGKAEIPVTKASRLKIPHPPEIELVSIKYKKFNFKTIQAEAKVKVSNHSIFNISVSDMYYKMNIEKFAILKGERSDSFKINAGKDSYVIFPIEIKIKKLETTIMDALRSDEKYHYILNVNALVSSSEFKQEKPTYLILKKEDETELLQ